MLLCSSHSVAALRSREETTLARAAMDPLSFLLAKGSISVEARPAENITEKSGVLDGRILLVWLLPRVMRVARRRRFPLELNANLAARIIFLMRSASELTLVWAECCWLQGGPEGAIFLLGTAEHILEPDGAVFILTRVLVGPRPLNHRPGHDGLVQNSHEFKCGMIGTELNSPCS